jgi:hypothetical protein
MSTAQNKIAGAPISWGVCEVPGWGYQLAPDRVLTEMREIGLAATELGPEGFLPAEPEAMANVLSRHRLHAIGGFTPLLLHRPDHDPLRDVIEVLERYAATGARALASCTLEAGSDQVPFADHRTCPAVCSRPPPGLRLPVSFSRVCRSPLGRGEIVSGCACPGHVWTTTSRPLTMPWWQGGYWVPTETAEQAGVSARTVERLVGASRPSKQEPRLPTFASYFTYRPQDLW